MTTKFELKRAELSKNLRDFSACIDNVGEEELRVVAGMLRMLADDVDVLAAMESARRVALAH